MRAGFLSTVFLLAACADTGQERVRVPLYLAGSDLAAPVRARDGSALRVTHAELAFGPLYLCAGNTAGELCDTARLEWLDSHVIDLTSAQAELVGELEGVSGVVRSWMYDLGISAQLTREEPFVLDAARALGDISFRVEGDTEIAGAPIAFRGEVAIAQSNQTELGVPVIRKSVSDDFEHDVQAMSTSTDGLLVRFDAAPWLNGLDLRPYFEEVSCSPDGPQHVCEQGVELTCTAAGEVAGSRDCTVLGQVCLVGAGCSEELQFEPGSEAYRALRDGLLVGARPSFEWGFSP